MKFLPLLAFYVLILMPLTNGQEISKVTVSPKKILPEDGELLTARVTMKAKELDRLYCNVSCAGVHKSFIEPTPDNEEVYPCIFSAIINATLVQACHWRIKATFVDDSTATLEANFTVGKSITVDRSPLFVEEGSKAVFSVVPVSYPDPLVCEFERRKPVDCEFGMVIEKTKIEDAGIHNISICLPGSADNGCVHLQKKAIVWHCTYRKQVISFNITDFDHRVELKCLKGCLNIDPEDSVQGNRSTVLTWYNVTGTHIIQGLYNGVMILNSSCDEARKGYKHKNNPQSSTNIGVVISCVIGGLVVIAAIACIVIAVQYCKRMPQQGGEILKRDQGDARMSGNGSTQMVLLETTN